MPIYCAQFLVQERNIFFTAEAAQRTHLNHCVFTQVYSAADAESAYQQALRILDGLSDAHNDGPGDRTEFNGLGLLELEAVDLFGRSIQDQLAEPYGFDAGQVTLSSELPKPKDKHKLDVFAQQAPTR